MKCHRYWPVDDEPVCYGEIFVTRLSEKVLKQWTVREFELQKVRLKLIVVVFGGIFHCIFSSLSSYFKVIFHFLFLPFFYALVCVFCMRTVRVLVIFIFFLFVYLYIYIF